MADLSSVPKVLVVTHLAESQRARLSRLEVLERIMVDYRVGREAVAHELDQGLLGAVPYDAVISRPTDGIAFREDHLRGCPRKFYACSKAVGIDQYDGICQCQGVTILNAQDAEGNSPNARSVAMLTFLMAVHALRPVHRGSVAMCQGYFDPTLAHGCLIEGGTWLLVGGRSQTPFLVQLISVLRPSRIFLCNRTMDAGYLTKCLSLVPHRTIEQASSACLHAEIHMQGQSTIQVAGYQGLGSLPEVVREADLISLHLAKVAATVGIFDQRVLRCVKEGAVLINTARGDLVVEEDILEALDAGRLRAYCADCVNGDAEQARDPSLSPLWTRFLRLQDGILRPWKVDPPNLYLTPHVGARTTEADEGVDRVTIDKLLDALAVSEV